jgi:glycosyltransferase involved in cell wall biosynthesis
MPKPTVAILMGTYNGHAYLTEQIDSILSQTYPHWQLWVSDDGSNDNTYQILKTYQRQLGHDQLKCFLGPQKGFAANFLSLVCQSNMHADYVAYADQDDIWESTKLQKALDWLATIAIDVPALYCARTKLIDNNNKAIGYSPLFRKKPSFLNALTQNIAGGNTIVFNHAALTLLRQAGEQTMIGFHDWWTYLLVTGAGGVVFYDTTPSVFYRQHAANLIGNKSALRVRLTRLYHILINDRLKYQTSRNLNALLSVKHLLTDKNKIVLDQFIAARQQGLIMRVIGLKKIGIYRQTTVDNVGLMLATLFNKL